MNNSLMRHLISVLKLNQPNNLDTLITKYLNEIRHHSIHVDQLIFL